jgi:hypothetical protein
MSSWAAFKAVGKQVFSGGGGELYVGSDVGKYQENLKEEAINIQLRTVYRIPLVGVGCLHD